METKERNKEIRNPKREKGKKKKRRGKGLRGSRKKKTAGHGYWDQSSMSTGNAKLLRREKRFEREDPRTRVKGDKGNYSSSSTNQFATTTL